MERTWTLVVVKTITWMKLAFGQTITQVEGWPRH